MTTMRDKWTDEDLDDFAAETARRFEVLERRFDRLERRFDETNARFGALHSSIIQVGGGLLATFAIGFIGLVVMRV